MRIAAVFFLSVLFACATVSPQRDTQPSSEIRSTWVLGVKAKGMRTLGRTNQVAFKTVETVRNYGGCPKSDYYVIGKDYDQRLPSSVLLSTLLTQRSLDIEVIESECHPSGQTVVGDIRVGEW